MAGIRQRELLTLLLRNKTGLTVEEFSQSLGITRNAVRQHLDSLESDRLVQKGETRPSGGRPEQLYVLTEKGNALFPRHYSWFAQMLFEMVEAEVGPNGMAERLDALGSKAAAALSATVAEGAPDELGEKVRRLAAMMEDLGYSARASTIFKGIPVIEADNCVFHDLAKKHTSVCRFDLALLAGFTGARVDHAECMAKGGNLCRFRFEERTDKPAESDPE